MRIILLAVAAMVAGTSTAQAKLENFVRNGNFESAVNMPGQQGSCLFSGGHACYAAGWHGTAPLLQAASDALGKSDTPYGKLLAGLQNDASLEQELSLPAAGRYTLSWSDAGPLSGAAAQAYSVSFDGVTLDTHEVSSGAGWQHHTVTFNAAGSGVLRFQGQRGRGGAAYIDNVAMTAPVPEPSGYCMLLVGLGLLAFTRHEKLTPKFKT